LSSITVPTGRAADVARSALRAVLGTRMRAAGPDRTELLAADASGLTTHAATRFVGGGLDVVPVPPPSRAQFEGFLDGIQRSVTLAYLDGVPLLHGTAAAAIRERDRAGRMRTWRAAMVEHAVFASHAALGPKAWNNLSAVLAGCGHTLENTDAAEGAVATPDEPPSAHPAGLLRVSLNVLSKVRDRLERSIGQRWCDAHADRALYVDGSLRTSTSMQRATGAVGVVKSHARLYVQAPQVRTLLALRAAERTSVIEVLDADGVVLFHTWYLRLRGAEGRDPFFGLIRVETGVRSADVAELEARASVVSQWLLAERSPVAKPDGRWDVMPYAIRDCEVYLRAVA
jgi:hypothetical protein